MGLYTSWKRRAYIRITNRVAMANYPHFLTITWMPGMRSDFRDLRFTTQSGQRCRYWIETYTTKTSAKIWIKIPTANQPGLFMYYENNAVVSESNGVNTFDFFDDFDTLDTTTKWDTNGTPTVSGGILTLNSASEYVRSKAQYGVGYAFRSYSSLPATAENQVGWHGNTSPVNAPITIIQGHYPTNNVINARTYVSAGTNTNLGALSGYHIYDISRVSASSAVFSVDNTVVATHSTNVPTGNMYFGACSQSGTTSYHNYVIIRKCVATEPTLSVVWRGRNPVIRSSRIYAASMPSTSVDHTFPTVNIDHNMVAGVGPQEISLGVVNVNHGMTPGVGIVEVEMGPVNIYHPMYPSAKMQEIIEPVTGNTDSLVTASVHQGTDDVMMQADFEYDGDDIGNHYSGDYLRRVVVKMPDYLGTVHTVFVGICPSSTAHYEPAKDKMVMRAFDYGLYLTSNPLETKDLSLLPPDNQTDEGANVAKVLDYRNATHTFQIGQRVIGDVSAASGEIIELVQGDSFRRMTLYPATGKFVDGENLSVGGVTYAIADGRSVDIPYTPFYSTRTPADWFKSILGGENCMNVTGIRPKKIIPCGWSSTSDPPAVPMIFGSQDSRMAAAKEFAAYLGYIVLVKLGDWGSGLYGPDFYAVPIASIDDPTDGLDLPASLTIANPDDFMDGSVELEQNGEAQYDRIWVRCRDLNGIWMEAIRTNSRVDNGEGPYRTLLLEPENIATRTDMNDYADLMYDLHVGRACTWTATFYDRPDIELYQRIIFSGYGIKIPNGTYRIIHIKKDYGCAINKTTCLLMLATDWDNRMKSTRTPSDSIKEVERIAKKLIETEAPPLELATCTANDGHTVTYMTDEGATGQGLDGTATPAADGVIGVGSRISINHARGGLVCIPIVGSTGSSTDLLVVDPPTIVEAVVDSSNHNYWFLQWTPGANNQTVSVNYQTSGYPSAPGTVVAHGNPASCRSVKYPISTVRIRIRFSGPSTTYYIKLWGEKNGVYSTTGATATITSGSDVTVGDSEEPEPIGVIDQLLCAGTYGESVAGTTIYEIFNGPLPFMYNGTDNIYLGGPVLDTLIAAAVASGGKFAVSWVNQPTPRYIFSDDLLIVTGPKGVINITTLGAYGWKVPVNIKNLLNVGSNTIKIEISDVGQYVYGSSDIWVRTYYL